MDELIVRIARAIACGARLRILSSLAKVTESAPTQLARELDMPKSLVSDHLRILSAVGLMQCRRSGVWCYCRADSPYDNQALSGKLMSWLRDLLAEPSRMVENRRVRELCDSPESDPDLAVRRLVFEAVTAFTNVRRVQLLRRLAATGEAGVETLSDELSMSEDAVGRHLAKLARRGYVVPKRDGRRLVYALANDSKTPVHGRLFEIVSSVWGEA
jgi:DNA-binding transcriptional ArsR family regulator